MAAIALSQAVQDATPYVGRGTVGFGLTGLILYLDDKRVVKVAKIYDVDDSADEKEVWFTKCINDDNQEFFRNEMQIYSRLGNHRGIITCFKISDYGIELAYAKEGDLENYIEKNLELQESIKDEWILVLIDALFYVHSRRVLIDEIALRNILIFEGEPQFCDFGASYLLPMDTNMDIVCENDLTAKLEILHLGWIIYAIAVWGVHKYYYFNQEDPQWPKQEELPPTNHLKWGHVIQKCWNGEYANVDAVKEEARVLMTSSGHDGN